ncbi:MAG: GNAT family N-acetyltransferase [bacterium]|nr:GNAT family N-acetyltransferase [bacterium]
MIRKFKNTDLKEVNELLKNFNYTLTLDSFKTNQFLKCIVYEENSICGVLLFDYIYDRIEIEYIFVLDEYRNNFIGSNLLKYLENYSNLKNITLEVKESNKIAIKFYQKNGYKISTIRKNYYGSEDGFLMIKNLGD